MKNSKKRKQKIAMLISIKNQLEKARAEHNTIKIHKLTIELEKVKNYLRK
jgi:hypothetical protein